MKEIQSVDTIIGDDEMELTIKYLDGTEEIVKSSPRNESLIREIQRQVLKQSVGGISRDDLKDVRSHSGYSRIGANNWI